MCHQPTQCNAALPGRRRDPGGATVSMMHMGPLFGQSTLLRAFLPPKGDLTDLSGPQHYISRCTVDFIAVRNRHQFNSERLELKKKLSDSLINKAKTRKTSPSKALFQTGVSSE